MLLLALETVTRAGSLALCGDGITCVAAHGDPRTPNGVRLPAELLRFLETAGRSLAEIDAFVVVTGPGSFTGLRVGLATVQGLALAGKKHVIGVPTLDAMASGWMDHHADRDGLLVPCLDGARGDVFFAAYNISGAGPFETARVVIEPSVAAPDAAAKRLGTMRDARAVTIVGDGAERYRDVFAGRLPAATFVQTMPNLADGAGRLALRQRLTPVAPHALRPIYIRRPDAELARDRAAAVHFQIAPVIDAAGRAEVAALQARTFGEGWGADGVGGGEANRDIARIQGARDGSGAMVGYAVAWLVVDELHVHSVAVDPAFQRKGIAKALLERLLAEGRASGAMSATLEVRAANLAARALYERLGFVTEAVRPAYYRNPIDDALILWRRKL